MNNGQRKRPVRRVAINSTRSPGGKSEKIGEIQEKRCAAKTPENAVFSGVSEDGGMGDEGLELPQKHREITTLSENGAQSGAPALESAHANVLNDPDLATLVAALAKVGPRLSSEDRGSIWAIIKASGEESHE